MSLRAMMSLAFALISATLLISSPAGAVAFASFSCITNNNGGDCSIGATELSGTIVEMGGDAKLTITMTGTDNAVVEQIFIESTLVSGISFVGSVGSGSVAFGTGAAGGTLPGGTGVSFNEAYNIGSSNPKPAKGIGWHPTDKFSPQAGEFLLAFTGGDYSAMLADLRIGVHVIGFSSEGSESFVSIPVPEPGTVSMLATGLLGLAVSRRRRSTR